MKLVDTDLQLSSDFIPAMLKDADAMKDKAPKAIWCSTVRFATQHLTDGKYFPFVYEDGDAERVLRAMVQQSRSSVSTGSAPDAEAPGSGHTEQAGTADADKAGQEHGSAGHTAQQDVDAVCLILFFFFTRNADLLRTVFGDLILDGTLFVAMRQGGAASRKFWEWMVRPRLRWYVGRNQSGTVRLLHTLAHKPWKGFGGTVDGLAQLMASYDYKIKAEAVLKDLMPSDQTGHQTGGRQASGNAITGEEAISRLTTSSSNSKLDMSPYLFNVFVKTIAVVLPHVVKLGAYEPRTTITDMSALSELIPHVLEPHSTGEEDMVVDDDKDGVSDGGLAALARFLGSCDVPSDADDGVAAFLFLLGDSADSASHKALATALHGLSVVQRTLLRRDLRTCIRPLVTVWRLEAQLCLWKKIKKAAARMKKALMAAPPPVATRTSRRRSRTATVQVPVEPSQKAEVDPWPELWCQWQDRLVMRTILPSERTLQLKSSEHFKDQVMQLPHAGCVQKLEISVRMTPLRLRWLGNALAAPTCKVTELVLVPGEGGSERKDWLHFVRALEFSGVKKVDFNDSLRLPKNLDGIAMNSLLCVLEMNKNRDQAHGSSGSDQSGDIHDGCSLPRLTSQCEGHIAEERAAVVDVLYSDSTHAWQSEYSDCYAQYVHIGVRQADSSADPCPVTGRIDRMRLPHLLEVRPIQVVSNAHGEPAEETGGVTGPELHNTLVAHMVGTDLYLDAQRGICSKHPVWPIICPTVLPDLIMP